MQHGRERNDRLNRPFTFEEAVLSQKERVRVQKGVATASLFPAETEALTVEEYRICELSARIRTINNARDSGAVLPDGTPLTEVTMYGRRGEIYLLGPYSAIHRVMDGELPTKTKPLLEVTTASVQVKKYISRLTDGLDQLYANQKPTAFHSGDKKLEIRFGCGLSIDKMVLLLEGLNSELSLLETEINSWSKWWAPWGTPATEVAARVANVLRRFEESTAEFEASLTQAAQPNGNDVTAIFTRDALLFDELRCAFKTVSNAEAELQGLLSRMGGNARITNVQLLGQLTQLWPGDERHIEGALKALPDILSDILHTQKQLDVWRESGEPRGETLNEFVEKRSTVMGAFDTAMSNLVKQVVSSTGS